MLKQLPTLDITQLNRHHIRAQVDKVESHFIQSARDDIAELYDLHHFESNEERLEFIESLLAENRYIFPLTDRVEGSECGANPTHSVSKAANEWGLCTLHPGRSYPAVYLYHIFSSWEYPR